MGPRVEPCIVGTRVKRGSKRQTDFRLQLVSGTLGRDEGYRFTSLPHGAICQQWMVTINMFGQCLIIGHGQPDVITG